LFHPQNYKATADRSVQDRLANAAPGETPSLFSQSEIPVPKKKGLQEAEPTAETSEATETPDKSQRSLFTAQNYKDTASRTIADKLANAELGETPSLFSEREAPVPRQKGIAEAAKEEAPRETAEGERPVDTSTLDLSY
jgi:hypothetical protein